MQQLEGQELLKAANVDWGQDRIVSLQANDTPVKSQWNGTCTTFSTIAAIENKLGGKFDLSERLLCNYYGVFNTEQAIGAAKLFYILEDKYWPEFEPKFNTAFKDLGRFILSKVNYLATNYLDVIQAIDRGNPCIVALSTPVDLYAGKSQVEASSKLYHKSGHAICVSGYKIENGKAYFLVKNSWGPKNGSVGYQYIAFELYDDQGYPVFWEVVGVEDRGEQSTNKLNNFIADLFNTDAINVSDFIA